MELKRAQYEKIQDCFPKQRKPAKISNLEVLNAVLYVVENGCKWRRLPKEYGDLMDRAYEGDETRALATELGYIPVVPPKNNRKNPWDYDKLLYKQRNQVERLFRRLKRFRCIFTRYDKLDIVFLSFVYFALVVDTIM